MKITGSQYLYIWLFITLILAFESYRENQVPEKSIAAWMQSKEYIKKDLNLSPEPGKPISLIFGYTGFSIMLLTNLYFFRKRVRAFHKMGHLNDWLNFHIFCGLMGPTFIVFHANFKVRGLVAISFWSMMVSLSSGVIGRYLYIHVSKLKGDYIREAEKAWKIINAYIEKHNLKISHETLEGFKTGSLQYAGAEGISTNPIGAFFQSLMNDTKMLFTNCPAPTEMGDAGPYLFKSYAVSTRKSLTADNFVKLMGYWHTFHMPFGFYMYVVAIIHVAAALILGVAT